MRSIFVVRMNIEDSILPQLGKTVRLLDFYIEDQFAHAGIELTKLQFVFLMVIKNNNGQPQNKLAQHTGRDRTTFTRNIATIEKKGLVNRQPSPLDKRIKLVSITPKGLEVIAQAKPIIQQIITDLESDISTTQRQQFLHTLEQIKQKLHLLTTLPNCN